ncbi:MAG TPA: PPOX class F420-dependent oxidoreductase [Candidatus Sulfomarinibacteraceae bacterium]|nr:PPOX class F420-dependent oxidoreductase [Candidatus Sulfomarinibacteraceae bacterium]
MEINQAREFLNQHHHAVLATYRGDGRPQMSPILVGVNEEGQAIVSSRETAYKVKNLRRDSRASVCVFTDAFFGDWIQVDGTAHILSMPQALEPLVDYYRRVVGEHPDWEEYRQAMADEKRVLIQINIDRAGPDRAG